MSHLCCTGRHSDPPCAGASIARPIKKETDITSATPAATRGFDAFGLGPSVLRGIDFAGYETPRPIQLETIPAVLDGADVMGLAQTGTGKTAAFALPILEQLMARKTRSTSVLVLAPTRELATQIHTEVTDLGQFTRAKSITVYGGVSIKRQIEALRRKPQIVVACPGRLLDLHRQGAIKLDQVDTLVIDEADHMLDLGFLPDVKAIIDLVPTKRQTMMFSATMPPEIRKLANDVLNDPLVVDLGNSKVVSTVEHEIYPVSQRNKLSLLQHLLGEAPFYSAIVFTRTKHRATRIARQLRNSGFDSAALQGNMSQLQRDKAMQGFRDGKFQILVATDIAARGIDIANVTYVINYDFPNTPDAYIHRIGRTGRSEQEGRAFTFVIPDDEPAVRALEKKLGKRVNRCVLPEFAELKVTEDGKVTSTQPGAASAPEPAPSEATRGNAGDRKRRPPKGHRGHQTSRGRRSRARHRKHASRSTRSQP